MIDIITHQFCDRQTSRWPMVLSTLLSVATLALPQLAQSETLKLLAVEPGGSTALQASLPLDNGRAILSADDNASGVFDVFSVSLAGGLPVRLNEPLSPPFTFAYPLRLSVDGSTVVYGVDGNAGLQLYSVPVLGPESASVRLDLDVAWDLDFNRVFISGDGQHVVFEGNQEDEDIYELFSIPTRGPAGAMVKLNGPLLSSSVSQPVISRDQQTLVYQADQDALEPNRELYSVPMDGSAPSAQISGGGSLGNSPIATDTHVVFWRNNALFSVPIAGPASAAVEISVTPATGDRVRSNFFQVTPDNQSVVYFITSDNGDYLSRVPVAGPASANVRVTPIDQDVVEFKLAGNQAVVYDQRRADGVRELYSVPITGPSTDAVKLNQDFGLTVGGSSEYQVSPDLTRVAFQATLETAGQSELWSVPLEGPASAGIKLNPPLPAAADVFFDFVFSPDSQRLAYRVDIDTNDVFELFSVGSTGPAAASVKISGPLASGGDVCANSANCYRFAPDSSRVVYQADADADRETELFIADDGRAAAGFVSPAVTGFEGSTVTLEIDLGAASVLPVTLNVEQTGGTATADDFTLTSSVVIAPGTTTAQVPVSLVADPDADAGETLELSLTNVQNAQTGIPFTTVITIRPEGEIFFDGFE
ncbi:MAG: TolB family protein [Lysobacterales bacterium]